MLPCSFTCTGPYAALIAKEIKTVENRAVMPEASEDEKRRAITQWEEKVKQGV